MKLSLFSPLVSLIFARRLRVQGLPLVETEYFVPVSNTNQCIQDLGGIFPCQQLGSGALSFLRNIRPCCDGIRNLAVDLCECNPTLNEIVGEADMDRLYGLERICRVAQPLQWLTIRPRRRRRRSDCSSVTTYEYGCEDQDINVDAARFHTIQKFQGLFETAGDNSECFDSSALVEAAGEIFAYENSTVYVPYGIGLYRGAADIMEYLGIAFTSLNHGYWLLNQAPPSGESKGRLDVSEDGLSWFLGSTQEKGSFLGGDLPYTMQYAEQELAFNGCETKISDYKQVPVPEFVKLIEIFVQSADLSKRYGTQDICRYHTQYCAGDPTTKQYENEQECLDYISSLPLYTEACGINRPLAGNSRPCKFKHHFMIPTNPSLHCAHIGKAGSADKNGALKCDDVYECSADEGQDDWPPILRIGNSTPSDRVAVFEKNDEGFENEPFPCLIQTPV